MRKFIISISVILSLAAIVYSLQLRHVSMIETTIQLPKYLDINETQLEKLENEELINLVIAGLGEAQNIKEHHLKSLKKYHRTCLFFSVLMFVLVILLSFLTVRQKVNNIEQTPNTAINRTE